MIIEGDPTTFEVGTVPAVAKLFGVNSRTVAEWKSRGLIGSPYNISAMIKAIRARDIENAKRGKLGRTGTAPVSDEASDDLVVQKLQRTVEKLSEEVREKSRENAAAEGELIPADETERELVKWAVTFRNSLLQFPVTLANMVPDEMKASVKTMAEDHLRVLLDQATESPVLGSSVNVMILAEADRLRSEMEGDS